MVVMLTSSDTVNETLLDVDECPIFGELVIPQKPVVGDLALLVRRFRCPEGFSLNVLDLSFELTHEDHGVTL